MGITASEIGQNIQHARYRRGFTQAELALKVDLDRTALSRIENGARSLAAAELPAFAAALNVPIQELLLPSESPARSVNAAKMLMRAGPVTENDEPQLGWFVDLVERAWPA